FHRDFYKSKEKCAMKLLGKLVCTGILLFLFYAAPAFAQFEVNPDHFDNVMNQTPTKTHVAPKRQAARQRLGTGRAAQQSHAQKSQAQPARTSSSVKTQVASAQRHGHARKAPLRAKASAKVQPQSQTAQVARVARE